MFESGGGRLAVTAIKSSFRISLTWIGQAKCFEVGLALVQDV
jgi:hypothetical protein